jgi:hypothetical protein
VIVVRLEMAQTGLAALVPQFY